MATTNNQVKFWRGLSAAAPAVGTRDVNTIYFFTDTKEIYQGNGLIANASEVAVDSITNDEIDAIVGATIYNINEVEL